METILKQHTYARTPLRSFAEGDLDDPLKLAAYSHLKGELSFYIYFITWIPGCLHTPTDNVIYFAAVTEARGEAGSLPGGMSVWRPVSPRFMGFPYSAHLQDRSMYSIYGSLLGLNGASLPGLPMPLTTSALTPTSGLGSYLLAAQAGQDSNTSIYQHALYGQRYHPYLSLSSPTNLKRPSTATESSSSPSSLSIP